MKKLILPFLLAASILISCNDTARKAAASQNEILAKASISEKNGWKLVHLEGKPEVIGFQHGYLLARDIMNLKGAMAVLNRQSTGKDWEYYRNESFRLLWKKVPEEYRAEMNAIAAGVNARLGDGTTDIKDIVAINSFLEIPGYYVPWIEGREKTNPPEHCSAIAATGTWTADGKIVIAHNNWSEYAVGARWNIILDIVPETGNRIIMDALPGFIHSGDDFNINSAGLIITETTISNFKGFDTTATAEFVRARKAVQYASSIDEWASIMIRDNNGGYANDWLIGDNKTGEIARLELGLKNHTLERTSDGCFTGANYPVNPKLLAEETSFDTTAADASPNMRKLRWNALLAEYRGKIDIEAAKRFLGDHYDSNRKTERAGRFSLCGHLDEDDAGKNEISWDGKYFHAGAVQGKATDGNLAAEMKLWAIMGHPCGKPFIAKSYLAAHPEYEFEKEYLIDMPGQVWTLFSPVSK